MDHGTLTFGLSLSGAIISVLFGLVISLVALTYRNTLADTRMRLDQERAVIQALEVKVQSVEVRLASLATHRENDDEMRQAMREEMTEIREALTEQGKMLIAISSKLDVVLSGTTIREMPAVRPR